MINSAFSLSHWFGVLFINVFGSWIGNFGTAPPAAPESDSGPAVTPTAVFTFAPAGEAGGSGATGAGLARVDRSQFGSDDQFEQFNQQVSAVLADHDITPTAAGPKHQPGSSATIDPSGLNLAFLPIFLGIGGLAAVGAEKIHAVRRSRQ
jgi:hypothetical protein